jgi:hypothetical protein
VMLTPAGDVLWQRNQVVEDHDSASGNLVSQFTEPDSLEAIDSAGNLYFSGSSEILKTNSVGQVLWRFTHTHLNSRLVVDAVGNVYTGDQEGDVLGISAAGNQMWSLSVATLGPYYLYNTAPILGPSGDIYVLNLSDQAVSALVAVPDPACPAFLSFAVATVTYRQRRSAARREQHQLPARSLSRHRRASEDSPVI